MIFYQIIKRLNNRLLHKKQTLPSIFSPKNMGDFPGIFGGFRIALFPGTVFDFLNRSESPTFVRP
ncbi:MAG: hypothetical protein D6714_08290 [Bacteroidetes bacterium]|nr:MAG: hypothetical protein D6714_08290 [Bacteroidota bacterium]